MLVTGIFSFSHNVFYPVKNKFQFDSHIYFVVCNRFQFGLSLSILEICRFGTELIGGILSLFYSIISQAQRHTRNFSYQYLSSFVPLEIKGLQVRTLSSGLKFGKQVSVPEQNSSILQGMQHACLVPDRMTEKKFILGINRC